MRALANCAADGLFSKNATEGQKFRGFMLFQKFIQGLAAAKEKDFVKYLFTRNLMKCMINQAAKEDRYVHRAAVKSLKTVVDVVEAEPSFLLTVLTELLGKHGGYVFDQRTHSKTIEKLLQYTTQGEADAIFAMLRAPIVSIKDEEDVQVEKLRRVYADYLFKICTPEKAQSEGTSEDFQSAKGNILATAVREMAVCAYTKTDGSFKPDLSEKSREYFRNRLESAFARLTKRREDYRYLCDAVASIEPSAVEMSEEIETERKAALKALKKLIKSSSKSNEQEGSLLGLALLYTITILQLYNGDPDALNTLTDLKQCSEKIQEADDAASALLIEILLSLVSQPSPMMRQITQQVFEAFTAQFSADALERLTDPLTAEENIKGQQALFSAEDEEMVDADASDDEDVEEDDEDDGDDEDEISEIGSDVEFVTLNGAGGEDEDAEEGSHEEEEEGEGDDAQAQELADLDDALAKVLRSHRLDKDEDAESSDNDSDMTDSEMMALDDKLVEVFKQRTKKSNKKKENKDAKETMIIFKHRIMDFLDIYVKKEAQNPLAFDLLLPLLELIRTTSTKDLSNKAMKVISDFSDAFKKGKSKSKTSGTDIDTTARMELLQKVLQEATRDQSHAFARAVSMCALLLATSLAAAGEVERAIDAYTSAMKDFAKGTKYQPTIFSDFTNWLQSCPKP
jgi:DNA polymerase phi